MMEIVEWYLADFRCVLHPCHKGGTLEGWHWRLCQQQACKDCKTIALWATVMCHSESLFSCLQLLTRLLLRWSVAMFTGWLVWCCIDFVMWHCRSQWSSSSMSDCSARGPGIESRCGQLCLSHNIVIYSLGHELCAPFLQCLVNSAFYP